MRILLIGGSTRAGSTNAAVLETIVANAPRGVEARRFDGLAALPHFNPDDDREPLPAPVVGLRRAIAEADAILFCTPEYAGALPGSFKNLLDWTVGGTEISGKPVAWLNASGGPTRAADAHASLRKVLGYVGAHVVEAACRHVPVARAAIGAGGMIVDPAARETLLASVRALVAHVTEAEPEVVPVIETTDLVLREFVPSDWEAVHAYAQDPDVVRYELWGPNTEVQTIAFVNEAIRGRSQEPRRSFELAITRKDTGQLIGGAGLRIRDERHREADIGYALHKAHWGQGLGTQAARGLVRFGFERLGLHRIWATCHAENVASAKVLARAGLRKEGVLRAHRFQRGAWRDSLLFAIVETDPRSDSTESR